MKLQSPSGLPLRECWEVGSLGMCEAERRKGYPIGPGIIEERSEDEEAHLHEYPTHAAQ